ncbi:M48 family metallopeptidase [Dyadobacter sp. CY356]|uniref:M48 family metallopeptidase n=1 Tax=Dyadobacter sp. CY356 TaxID=2906442 RepID=UPI001F3C0740|nr:M48 family metallopeptidase [Dyadobacter sp. CY356]MCF0059750.1 M48 family metallopeptidase [Dyadobacter sp. CY356]
MISQNRKYAIAIILVTIMLLVSCFLFFRKTEINPVTGKKQHITLTVQQEITLGLQCAPDMAAKYGGLDADIEIQNKVKNIGQKLVAVKQVSKSPFQFDFHVLSDSQIVNSLSLPGGQVFITKGLFKLLKTESEIAAVLSHEIGHVIGRHSAEKLAGFNILREFSDSTDTSRELNSNQIPEYLSDLLKITFNANEESEADELALKYLIGAGYKANILPETLEQLYKKQEELNVSDFLDRHPVTESRIENLKSVVRKLSKN